jgi:hypothetical protein
LIRSPILKVLSTIQKRRVTCLLMGGQACVFYGAAEFSRDTDLVVLAEADNLARLTQALDDLRAERIAVPPFESRYLEMGLAVHFRCQEPAAMNLRIDVMTKLRGVAPFAQLWDRRTTIEMEGTPIDLLSVADLVTAKKTQRDKDWPMIARLLETDYAAHYPARARERANFWLRELRTPELLVAVAREFSHAAQGLASSRPLLTLAIAGDVPALRTALRAEEDAEREADRQYWAPLKAELARLREAARQGSS